MMDDEDRNPVETELESFFNDTRTGARPKADINIGLNDSIAVILSNIAMEEDRKVRFNEMEKMGADATPQQIATDFAAREASYTKSLQAKKKMS